MKRIILFFAACAYAACTVRAAIPQPAQLLPPDTLALISVPDWEKASGFYRQSPAGLLWQDVAIKNFKDKLLKKIESEFAVPLERELGTKLADYAALLRGQVTLALTRNGWDGKSDRFPAVLLLIDSKDKSEQLKQQLADVTKKWVESGKQLKSETIRGVEVTTLMVRKGDLQRTLEKAFPPDRNDQGDDEKKAASDERFEIAFGQSESLLIAGNSSKEIERVLVRQSGTGSPSLADQAAYEKSYSARFRDAQMIGWVDFKSLYEVFESQAIQAARKAETENSTPGTPESFLPKPDKLLAATGLNGLQTISFKATGNTEGSMVDLFLSIPEARRQGVFKILAPEAKDASPPPFIPAEAVKYTRWRLDGQKAWATLESMVMAISPDVMAMVQMGLAAAGKDKDPNFDLKKSLIGNLGDDIISFEKSPRTPTLSSLSSPPSLFLVGSPNAEKLAQAFKAATGLMPLPPGESGLRERDFLGRKIYTIPTFPTPTKSVSGGRATFSFAASGGYVALSADAAMIEEFLRSAESSGKTLRETAGLQDAAQKVGGMSTGFFGYENQTETMRVTLEFLKNEGATLGKLLASDDDASDGGADKKVAEWLDFKLLPSFDSISKYFHFIIYNSSSTADGISWKLFAPTPPRMR